jgi:hypothetical protein
MSSRKPALAGRVRERPMRSWLFRAAQGGTASTLPFPLKRLQQRGAFLFCGHSVTVPWGLKAGQSFETG